MFWSEYKLIMSENIISQFSLDVQLAEARAFYSFQSMIEQVHSETYSLLIETYVRDQEEKEFLFRGMDNSELHDLSLLHATDQLTYSSMCEEESRLGIKVYYTGTCELLSAYRYSKTDT